MTKRVNALIARKNLGELLEGVFYRGDEVVVERAGKPMGVLIPMGQYEKITHLRAEALAKLEEHWARMPKTADLKAAELEIIEESEAARHGGR